jgi:hypothetical protein
MKYEAMKERSTAICAGGAVRAEVAWRGGQWLLERTAGRPIEAAFQLEIG